MADHDPRPARPSRLVRFYERAGDGAAEVLTPLAHHWRTHGADVELLRGLDQTDRWLLVVHEPPTTTPPPPAPPGTREWRFAAVAP